MDDYSTTTTASDSNLNSTIDVGTTSLSNDHNQPSTHLDINTTIPPNNMDPYSTIQPNTEQMQTDNLVHPNPSSTAATNPNSSSSSSSDSSDSDSSSSSSSSSEDEKNNSDEYVQEPEEEDEEDGPEADEAEEDEDYGSKGNTFATFLRNYNGSPYSSEPIPILSYFIHFLSNLYIAIMISNYYSPWIINQSMIANSPSPITHSLSHSLSFRISKSTNSKHCFPCKRQQEQQKQGKDYQNHPARYPERFGRRFLEEIISKEDCS